jgi:hypothetical protein
MWVLFDAAVPWDPHPLRDPHPFFNPHPSPPPFRGREFTEFAAPASRRDRASAAARYFLPLKGGGSRWVSPSDADVVPERGQGGVR